MSKLVNLVHQLSDEDYNNLFVDLMNSDAVKSATLLKCIMENDRSDEVIMEELDVSVNAFYTLRSRLNQKIEDYLLRQAETPRTELLRRVANINEIIFTQKKSVAISTIKKLEKELLDYDLSNELTQVYKALKKLHINHPDYYTYSQRYNRHVAFTLAVDKAEELLTDYFSKFGEYVLSRNENLVFELEAILIEMDNVSALYKSHRLYVYKHCILIFHKVVVEMDKSGAVSDEAIEDVFDKVEEIFDTYYLDTTYFHIRTVYTYLQFLYYDLFGIKKKVQNCYQELRPEAGELLTKFNLYTFPSLFFFKVFEDFKQHENIKKLNQEYERYEAHVEPNLDDIANSSLFYFYKAMVHFYNEDYAKAVDTINEFTTEYNVKKYKLLYIECKTAVAFFEFFASGNSTVEYQINSIQRLIRLAEGENLDHVSIILKLLRSACNENMDTSSKRKKIENNLDRLRSIEIDQFSALRFLPTDHTTLLRLIN